MASPDNAAHNIIQQIEDAFADVSYPGDGNIFVPDPHDDVARMRAAFKGKDWRDISPGWNETTGRLEYGPDEIIFFTPEGFRYYLPAYLIEFLKNFEKLDVILTYLLIALYSPANQEAFDADTIERRCEEFEQRMALLSDEQKEAVRAVLRYELKTHPEHYKYESSTPGVKKYWGIE